MRRVLSVSLCVCLVSGVAFADTFGTGANQFDIDFVTISGDTNPASGYGIVNNDYRIGVYEITNDQWNKFKNAYGMVTGDPSSAYNENPSWTGTNIPTNEASWYEAAQFVNWLNTDAGYAPAYKFTGTQGTGSYSLGVWQSGDAGYDAANPYRNSNAFYFLPTEDEWVKAAHWNGSDLQTYATKVGETLHQGDGTSGTGWNYWDEYEGYAIDTHGPWDVGSGSEELNGTFDMTGNLWEWMESPYDSGNYASGSDRVIRGGVYNGNHWHCVSSLRYGIPPNDEGHSDFGFRVASEAKPLAADIDIDPDTLDLASKDKWVTCYIELPSGYDVMDIDGSTVALEGIPAYIGQEGWARSGANTSNIMDHDGDGIRERMVKFYRSAIQEYVIGAGLSGYVELTVTGDLVGRPSFEGADVIRVKYGGN